MLRSVPALLLVLEPALALDGDKCALTGLEPRVVRLLAPSAQPRRALA